MSYKLEKPYTEKERMDFIVTYNHNQGLLIKTTENAVYALEEDEIFEDGLPVKDPDYETKKRKKEIKMQIFELQNKLTELDGKRIRAVCENEVKDEQTGETWLEYYNKQVKEIRAKMSSLSEKIA